MDYLERTKKLNRYAHVKHTPLVELDITGNISGRREVTRLNVEAIQLNVIWKSARCIKQPCFTT